MKQLDGIITKKKKKKNKERMVCKLHMSIYGLKQASRSQNIKFDLAIKSFGFEQNLDKSRVYKRHQDKVVTFLVLMWITFYSLGMM